MKLYASLAIALCLTAATLTASAQTTQPFTDPANLRGERVTPLNGHELPIDQGPLGLEQLLRKLNTRASLMLIVAHPDDEDGGMLTLYSRGLGARVADLSLNRGEGGQNAMTGDFEDALGLIRTQELLSADRYFDASQMFGTEVDFGFSKTKEESFAKWGHQRVLYDVVRAIRLYRPLVIASVWIGSVTDGHGQHQVAGEIAQEAFVAAADSKVFPELTAEGILPWAPLKIYARVPRQAVTAQGLFDYATSQYTPARFTNYVTGAVTTTLPSTDVVIHEGVTDPLLTPAGANPTDLAVNSSMHGLLDNPYTPLSYVQFARIGLGLQRSQVGPGMRLPPPGAFDIGYHLYGSRLCNAPAGARLPSTIPQNCHPEQCASPQNCHPDPELAEGEGPAFILSSNLSSRPESAHFADAAERPAALPTAALPPSASTPDSPHASFFDGIDTSVEGIATLAPDLPMSFRAGIRDLSQSIARATSAFEAAHSAHSQDTQAGRESIAVSLADSLKIADALITGIQKTALPPEEKQNLLHELRIKRVQLNDAFVLSLGLELEATSTRSDSTEQTYVEVATRLSEKSQFKLTDVTESLLNSDQQHGDQTRSSNNGGVLARRQPYLTKLIAAPSLTSSITRPFFRRSDIEQPVYQIFKPDLRLAPQTPPALTAWATVSNGMMTVQIGRIVHYEAQPLNIVPKLGVALSVTAQVLPSQSNHFPLSVSARFAQDDPDPLAKLELGLPPQWSSNPVAYAVNRARPSTTFDVTAPAQRRGEIIVTAIARTIDGHPYNEGFRPVGYPGLITTNFYTPATDRIVPVDLKLPPENLRRIAYLPGTGDAVPEALASIGLTPTILTVADLTPAKLAAFDTVILGVRTYNAHPDLHGAPTQALLDYARNGGNVLVQYQTAEFTAADAPYPLTLGNAEKVVDETAPVRLLDLNAPLLTTPNRITPADFNGWIEERGHGFLHTWDSHYTALTETHDPGQLPQLGGLITTPLGKGRWTYVAFALYRQLPEAVPGAYRLFVNLLNP